MAFQDLGAFYRQALEDEGLSRELDALSADQLAPRLVELGASRGYDFTIDEVESMIDHAGGLGEEELEQVAGGICIIPPDFRQRAPLFSLGAGLQSRNFLQR